MRRINRQVYKHLGITQLYSLLNSLFLDERQAFISLADETSERLSRIPDLCPLPIVSASRNLHVCFREEFLPSTLREYTFEKRSISNKLRTAVKRCYNDENRPVNFYVRLNITGLVRRNIDTKKEKGKKKTKYLARGIERTTWGREITRP